MINVTLTSDYGNTSHYIAAIKGNLYKLINDVAIIDVSHHIENFNRIQAAFVLSNVFENFKDKTIHLVCVDANLPKYKQIVIAEVKNQYFVSLDNGILNLIFGKELEDVWIYNLQEPVNELFVEKNMFTQIAKHLALNKPIGEIAKKGKLLNKAVMQNVITENDSMIAQVSFIDGFGNAFINVTKQLFNEVCKGRKFKIFYARKEFFDKINTHYNDVNVGAELILFNENNFLEIAINEGNASQLLGLRIGSKIIIEFF